MTSSSFLSIPNQKGINPTTTTGFTLHAQTPNEQNATTTPRRQEARPSVIKDDATGGACLTFFAVMEGIGGGSGKGGGPNGYNNNNHNKNDDHDGGGKGGRWNHSSHSSSSNKNSSHQHHETPSQMTQATQDTSIASASSLPSLSRSSLGGISSALTPLRPRQIPLQALDARRLADFDDGHDRAPAALSNVQLVGTATNRPQQQQVQQVQQQQQQQTDAELLLRWRRRQVIVLASGSVGTLMGFVAIVLPTPALVLLAAWIALTVSALVSARQYAVAWYRQQLVRNGLGQYLPDSLYRLLTTESIHSFMTDDTFMLENRHLLLYFLPLPPPALERFVQRLAPRHVQRLHRPGLGHLLGESVMQIILGQDRYRQQYGRPHQQHLQHLQHLEQQQQQASVYDADQDHDASDDNDNATTSAADASSSPSSSVQQPNRQQQRPQRPALEVIIERPSQQELPVSRSSRRLDLDDDDEDDDGDSDLGIDASADDVLEGTLSDEEARAMAAAAILPLPLRWVHSGSETGRNAPLLTPAAGGSTMMLAGQSPAESALTLATPGVHAHAGAAAGHGDARSAGATASDDALSLAEEYAEEELVLTQAVINAVYDGVWTPLSRYFIAAAEDTAGPVTARLVTYGLGISAVSTALGLFLGMVGYRRGIYRRPTIMQAYPRENTLYTTIMLGIAGTGLTLLAHWQMNRGKKKGRSYFYSQFSRRASRKG
jgi:hypothetical protein